MLIDVKDDALLEFCIFPTPFFLLLRPSRIRSVYYVRTILLARTFVSKCCVNFTNIQVH